MLPIRWIPFGTIFNEYYPFQMVSEEKWKFKSTDDGDLGLFLELQLHLPMSHKLLVDTFTLWSSKPGKRSGLSVAAFFSRLLAFTSGFYTTSSHLSSFYTGSFRVQVSKINRWNDRKIGNVESNVLESKLRIDRRPAYAAGLHRFSPGNCCLRSLISVR